MAFSHSFTLFSLAVVTAALALPRPLQLPQVDLGYAVHTGKLNLDASGKPYYSFANIRYAHPPTGDLRWRAPVKVKAGTRDGPFYSGDDNHEGHVICNQALPSWSLSKHAKKLGVEEEDVEEELVFDSRATEDCLRLDVHVPEEIYEPRGPGSGAAVLVWINGGGFVFGHKGSEITPPDGLLARARLDDQTGIIFVALNYRQGIHGWLHAPGDDILSNVGLHDQRAGLEWVQDNIHRFGGDPSRVTVMGESAGGSSIMHHVTAWGGERGPNPFSAALMQSPSFLPSPNVNQTIEKLLRTARRRTGGNYTRASDLRTMDAEDLQFVNQEMVRNALDGTFGFGPAIDGDYVPALPGQLLARGQYDRRISIMAGHNLNESSTFVPQLVNSDEYLRLGLEIYMPGIPRNASAYVLDVLYPPDLSGAHGYTTHWQRAVALISDFAFACNARYLSKAFDADAFAYRFDWPPGYHAQDVPFTFYAAGNGSGSDRGWGKVDPALAVTMQRYFTRFTMRSDPNLLFDEGDLPVWPAYGDDGKIVTFGTGGVSGAVGFELDELNNERCDWWQKGLYLPQTA